MTSDLARRLVAHPRWEWLDGMALIAEGEEPPYRVVSSAPDMRCLSDADEWSYWGPA